MIDWLDYDWLRAVHIILVIALMAGLLMMPRLMVYQLETERGSETFEKMSKAIRSLRVVILNPALILTWVFGLLLIWKQWPFILQAPWMHIKLTAVIILSAFHGYFIGQAKKIEAGTCKLKPKTLRMMNEIPFVLAVISVIAVVVQPFA